MSKRRKDVETEREPAGRESLLGLRVFVTVAGAVLMALEIVGSRLLAPHFGNSVFVWGSLISVFLAALSLGYWLGGVMADRDPSPRILAGLSVVTAALVFLVPWLGHPICHALVKAGLAERGGPLVAATLLFLPPSFLLGMVSPFAVRIAARSVDTVGRAAGSLYALSTLGSIAGTLVTTFALVPMLGVSWILRGLAIVMLLLPLSLLASLKRRDAITAGQIVAAVLVGVIGMVLPARPSAALDRDEVVVLDEDTPYHHIQVTDIDHGRIRALRFDRYVESAIGTDPPYASLSDYTDFFHLAWLLRPDMKRVLFIGAGGGIGPRTFHETDPSLDIDVVDIDPRVLEVARDQFHMPADPNVHAIAKDGRMFLRASDERYDAIFLDAFTIGGRIPFHLATKEAFELASEHLADGGVFIMNTNSAIEGRDAAIFQSIGRTLREVFPGVQAFAEGWGRNTTPDLTRNVLFVASRGGRAPTIDEWRALALGFEPRSSVSRARMVEMASDLVMAWPDVSKAVRLTDEHAPIETMSF